MRIEERVRRRRDDEASPEASTRREPDRAVSAVLELQRSAGNQAFGRALSRKLIVTPVDYNPLSEKLTKSEVDANALKAQIGRAKPFWDALLGPERQRLDQLGRQDITGVDVPDLAAKIIRFLADAKNPRIALLSEHRSHLEEAIGMVAETHANTSEQKKFRQVQGMATTMSRAKGTPNTVQWNNVAGELVAAITALTAKLLQRNQYLAGVNYAVNDPRTTCTDRATFNWQQVRSPHENRAGWIQDHRVASIEPALDLAARAWLTHKAANGTAAEQGEINANFPNINAATSQAVENSPMTAPLRQDYLTNNFAQAVPNPAARINLGWARYAERFTPGCPFIEFTAENAGGISRFIYDYVNDRLYANTHYNWVDGFNPFFLITGGPAMR